MQRIPTLRAMLRMLLSLMIFSPVALAAQVVPGTDDVQQDLLEGLFEDYGLDDGGEIQPEWLLLLEDLLKKPLDINTARHEDLGVFFFLSGLQRDNIIRHRSTYGLFVSIYELQAVEGIDLLTMHRLYPFITAGRYGDGVLERAHYWQTGRREFTFRYERVLEQRRGFLPRADDSPPAYEGDPNRLVGRLRYVSGNKISYGVSFEKDAGESFFSGSNPQGFDFYSAHLFIRRPFKGCEQLALGDYGLNLGQGLLISTGFNANKTAAVTMIKRVQRTLFPMNSWQEARFFRGAAAEWRLRSNLYATTFASLRNRDGNVTVVDTSFSELSLQVTSFQQTGFHRTASEIANRNAFQEVMFGGGIVYQRPGLKLGVQGVHFEYAPNFSPTLRPYNTFYFRGNQLTAGSVDFATSLAGNQMFGEVAMSHNGGWGGTVGMLSSPDRRLQTALLARHFSPDYWNVWGAPFSESFQPRNETGVYAGLVFRPVFGWVVSGFVDVWKHPWLTFRSDTPVRGSEQLVRVEYRERRKWQVYAQFRYKGRTVNESGAREIPDQVPTYRQQLRLQFQYEINQLLTMRTRTEWATADGGRGKEHGYLVAHDVIYKPLGSRWSGTMRYALFRTDGYASRIYMFENDLLYTFGLRPYYEHGQRFYINLRYRPINSLTLEARYEQYLLFNQDQIGSGWELIDGNQRSVVKTQIRWLF